MSMTIQEAIKKMCPCTFRPVYSGVQASGCLNENCMAWEWDFSGGKQIACKEVFAKEEPERPSEVPAQWLFVPYNSVCYRFHAYWEQPAEENRENWTGHCHLIFRPCGGSE